MKVRKSTASRAKSRVVGILIAIGVVVFVAVITLIASAENKKTVSVVRLKTDVSANALITEDMIEEYEMYYKEFANYGVQTASDGSKRQSIVTWGNRDSVIGKRYAAYYLRRGTALFWDSTVKEQTKKNSYLYNMSGELLNIKLDVSDFGDMVVPGDTLNIRVSYTDTVYDLPSEEAYKLAVESGKQLNAVEKNVHEKLFSEVAVLDMLNADGNSIFDIYYDFISKSKAAQKELLASEEFIESVRADSILLEVTEEEADRFAEISKKSPEYLITLLPRTNSNAILDSLSDIQSALSKKSN